VFTAFVFFYFSKENDNDDDDDDDLYRIGDVGIGLSAAGVILHLPSGMQSHQRPFIVRYIVGQIAVDTNLV